MRVVITGSGGALPDPDRAAASVAVVTDEAVLQFDCGRGVAESLIRAGIAPIELDHLFFTHLHFDHISTYGYFVISSCIAGRGRPLHVWGPRGTARMSRGFLEEAHAVDTAFLPKVVAVWPEGRLPRPDAVPPIEVREILSGSVLELDGLQVRAARTEHFSELGIESYCYRVDAAGSSVFVSGDGSPTEESTELARGCDLLVCECDAPDPDMLESNLFHDSAWQDTRRDEGGSEVGHMTPTSLARFATAVESRALVLTHLGVLTRHPTAAVMYRPYWQRDLEDEAFYETFERRVAEGFAGQMRIADDGLEIDLSGGEIHFRPSAESPGGIRR